MGYGKTRLVVPNAARDELQGWKNRTAASLFVESETKRGDKLGTGSQDLRRRADRRDRRVRAVSVASSRSTQLIEGRSLRNGAIRSSRCVWDLRGVGLPMERMCPAETSWRGSRS